MSKIIDLNISIPQESGIKHLEEKSFYDHNYYYVGSYGDWFYGDCDVIYQVYDECYNAYGYTLGYFKEVDGKEKFEGVIHWTNQIDIFEVLEDD